MIFSAPAIEASLTQGDIVDACPIFGIDPTAAGDPNAEPRRWRERVIVLTQACDLAQAKAVKVVVAIVYTAQDIVERGILKASVVRDHVQRGAVHGWYFLPAAPEGVAVPESVIDLRDLHTVPRAVLERLIADGKRVARVQTPYREHLAQHFAVTYMRIGLPEPFATEP